VTEAQPAGSVLASEQDEIVFKEIREEASEEKS
jgi:hypothetical protein